MSENPDVVDAQRNILLHWTNLSASEVATIKTAIAKDSAVLTMPESPHGYFWKQLIKLNWGEELPPFQNTGAPAGSHVKPAAFRLTDLGQRALPPFIDYGKLFELTECNNAPQAQGMPPVQISEWMANIDKVRDRVERRQGTIRRRVTNTKIYRFHPYFAAAVVSCVTAVATLHFGIDPFTSKIIMTSLAFIAFYFTTYLKTKSK